MAFLQNEHRAEYPRPIRRNQVLLAVICIGCGAAFFILVPENHSYLIAILAAELAGFMFFQKKIKSWIDKAMEHGLELCTHCGQPMSDGPECSRCGRRADRTEARKQWRAAILRHPPKRLKPTIPAVRRYTLMSIAIPILTMGFLMASMYVYGEMVLRSVSAAPGTGATAVSSLMPYEFAFMGIISVSMIAAVLFIEKKMRALPSKAREHDFRLCITCFYPLDAEAESGTCPECGSAYEAEDVRRQWYIAWGRRHIREAAEMDIQLTPHPEPDMNRYAAK